MEVSFFAFNSSAGEYERVSSSTLEVIPRVGEKVAMHNSSWPTPKWLEVEENGTS